MKGLILKDLYNMQTGIKQMAFIFIIIALIFIPNGGTVSFIPFAVIMCSTMVITTMSYDNMAKWDKYALSMPLTRDDMVLGKYIVMYIFNLLGIIVSVIPTVIYGLFTNTLDILSIIGVITASMSIGITCVSIVVPFIYKYGVERARIILAACYFIPMVIFYLGSKLAGVLNIPLPGEAAIITIILCSPILAIIISLISYKLSCRIFKKTEL